MLEFLVDNIFMVFGGMVFQQIFGIPMGTNCAPLLADIFLYSYEAEFIQSLLSAGWLVVLMINFDLAIFQPYLDLDAGDNSSDEAGNQTPDLLLRKPRAEPLGYHCSLLSA